MRTLVNVNSGGKTGLSGIIHGLLLLTVLLGLGPYASLIPLPVLAGILITVGIGIIDYKGIRHLTHVPRADAVVMLLVLGLTVFVDLIQAVAAGMILASILFMKQMSDQVTKGVEIEPLKNFLPEMAWDDENIPDQIANKIFVKHFNGPIFFGFAPAFLEISKTLPDIRVVIFRMLRVPHIDQTGLYAMEEVIKTLEARKIAVVFTALQEQPKRMMHRVNIIPGLVPEHYCFENFDDCVSWIEEELTDNHMEDMNRFFDELGDKSHKLDPKFRL